MRGAPSRRHVHWQRTATYSRFQLLGCSSSVTSPPVWSTLSSVTLWINAWRFKCTSKTVHIRFRWPLTRPVLSPLTFKKLLQPLIKHLKTRLSLFKARMSFSFTISWKKSHIFFPQKCHWGCWGLWMQNEEHHSALGLFLMIELVYSLLHRGKL